MKSTCDFCKKELDFACISWATDYQSKPMNIVFHCFNDSCMKKIKHPKKTIPHVMRGTPQELSKWTEGFDDEEPSS
jgi:hypothetical protein